MATPLTFVKEKHFVTFVTVRLGGKRWFDIDIADRYPLEMVGFVLIDNEVWQFRLCCRHFVNPHDGWVTT